MKSDALDRLLGSWAVSIELSSTEAAAIRNRIVAPAPSRQSLTASWWRGCFSLPDAVFRVGDWRGAVAWKKS